ncbi:MAG: CPXCG motif-containing cysteine-rich protein [Chromatiales bacterium]|nr:CPXCG motif-containing cysteine-rich protein [Chromatiales bacterium]
MIEDIAVTCPCCWEPITLEVDLSVEHQEYIEDCPVCCRPLRVLYHSDAGEVTSFSVDSAE